MIMLLQIIRRRYYLLFKKKYIEESLKNRKGSCKRCSCCEPKFCGLTYKCDDYDPITKSCGVFGTDKMPATCRIYPFDKADCWDAYKDNCGFYWEKK